MILKNKILEKLEIIIVTYNRGKFLKKTLESILNSPVSNLDITILDNCSTDGTRKVIKNYCSKFNNINHIRHNKNIGGNANIASAYVMAKKDYVWVICDDDEFDWSNWNNIEQLILDDEYDAIMLNPTKDNIAEVMINATFVPSQIYKTKWINTVVIENMFCNVPNLFPHLAIMANIINNNGNVYTNEHNCIINRGKENDSFSSYVRDLDDGYIMPSRKNMFWFPGYINSLSLLSDKKNIDYILDNIKFIHSNLFELLIYKIGINRYRYNNSIKNLIDIFLGLNIKWRFLFIICFIFSYLTENSSKLPISINEWIKHIHMYNVEKRLNKICKNKKTVVVYGIGMVFEALIKCGADLSQVKYICDSNYSSSLEKYGIEVITKEELKNINLDCIIVAPKKQFNSIKKQLRESGIKCPIKSLIK